MNQCVHDHLVHVGCLPVYTGAFWRHVGPASLHPRRKSGSAFFDFFDFVENSGTQSSSLSSVSVTASLVSDDISESLSANNSCNNSSSSMMLMCLSTCIHSTYHRRRAVKMNSAYPTLSNIMHQRMRSCHRATNQKGVLNWGGYYA